MPSPYAEGLAARRSRRPFAIDDPVFEHVADARRLLEHPEVHFDTKQARVLIAACLAIIDQQRGVVHRVNDDVWDSGYQAGLRFGFTVGGLAGLACGAFAMFALRGVLG